MLGGHLDVIQVPIPADCTDGFNAAYWRRPRGPIWTRRFGGPCLH